MPGIGKRAQRKRDMKLRHEEKVRQKTLAREREIARLAEEPPIGARMREDGSYFIGSREVRRDR